MTRRVSVFDRLGPLPDRSPSPPSRPRAPLPPAQGAAWADEQGDEPAAPPGFDRPAARVVLQHPLVASQLHQVASSRAKADAGRCQVPARGADQQQQAPTGGAEQQGQRRRRQPRTGSSRGDSSGGRARQQHGGSSSGYSSGEPGRQQRGSSGSRRGQGAAPAADAEVQEQLRRLQAERDAAEEAAKQMALQAQALLAEKQALAQQAAALRTQKQQLEERLGWLEESLGGEEDDFCLHSGEASEDVGSVSRGSAYQPSTPSASAASASLPDAVAALAGHLEATALAAEGGSPTT